MFLWRLDNQEVFAWIIIQPTVQQAIVHFSEDGLGSIAGKSEPLSLEIGDACYKREAQGNAVIVFRRNNLLTRVTGNKTVLPTLLRFAQHLDALFEGSTTRRIRAFQKGEIALNQGRYEEAIEEFKRARDEGDGDSAEIQRLLALAYLKLDRRDDALASLKEAIRLRPDFAKAHYDLGVAYYETGDFTNAAGSFEEAIRINPDFDALVALGKTYQHSGLYLKAVDVLRKATLIRPDAIDAKTALGVALIMAAQPEDAAKALQEAIRLSPQSAFAHATLGQAYRLMGKFQEAIGALQEALRISPGDPLANNYLGQTYQTMERHPEAVEAFKQAITLKPNFAEAHFNLGVLYLELGSETQARQEYLILKQLESEFAEELLRKLTASK
jgi:tetratricopeptide (TPR) repeat protein